MDQKNMMDRIRHSAEHIEVPEQLTPQKVEEQLRKSDSQKSTRRKKIMIRWMEAAAVLALVAVGGTQIGTQKQPGYTTEARLQGDQEILAESVTESEQISEADAQDTMTKGYAPAESKEELYEALKEYQSQAGYYAKDLQGNQIMMLEESASADTAASDTGSFDQGLDYSQTNVREAGVDEGDVVKTDGNYLYVVKANGSIRIVDIQSGKMNLVSTIIPEVLSESIEELYLDGDRLIAVTSGSQSSMKEEESDVYTVDRYTYSAVSVYDISDREHPEQIGRMTQEGTYVQSRKNGAYMYLLTRYSPTVADSIDDSDIIPYVNEQTLDTGSIYLPLEVDRSEYLVASGIDLSDPSHTVSSKAIVSGASDFYMSTENLYICNQNWENGKSSTQILKFACSEGNITAGNMAELPGYLNDTFSLDEYQGNLRILTTEDSNGESNSLFILDKDMEIISSLRDIASGETVRSARFVGNMGYFVTFRQTDPLFCVDLSDPEDPKILSELKLTGFSSYLHSYGENLLLGIGYEADEETGSQTGVKLSMFDISDPEAVAEQARYVIKDAYYLPFDYNYKAVTVDSNKNLIGFVCDGEYLVFRYDEEKGFENLLTYTMSDSDYWDGQDECRGVYAGDKFYIIDREKILCFDMEQDFALTDRLDWN